MSNLGYPNQYPFNPQRLVSSPDWDEVVDNLTGSQVKSGSLTVAAPYNFTVGGTTTVWTLAVTGSSTIGSLSITGSTNLGVLNAGNTSVNILTVTGSEIINGPLTLNGSNNAIIGGNLTVSGSVFGIISGSIINTGSIIVPSGSSLTLQSGSIIPFASPANYIIFSGSITGINGPYYAINGLTNNVDFAGSQAVPIFNAVFNAVQSGSIIFKPGIYIITGSMLNTSLNVHDNLTLIGDPNSTVFQVASGSVINMIYNVTANNIVFNGIIFDGNRDNVSDGSASQRGSGEIIIFGGGNNIKFIDCTFQKCRIGAALDFDFANNIVIDRCRFLYNGTGSAKFQCDHVHFASCSGSSISNSYFFDCTDTGLAQDSCQRHSIVNCMFIDCANQGLTIANFVTGSSKSFTISNCTFQQYKYSGYGIQIGPFGGLYGGNDISISNCSFINEQSGTGSAAWGIIANQFNRLLIENCTFRSFSLTGSGVLFSTIGLGSNGVQNNGAIIRGNYILSTGSGLMGMFINNLQNFNISDNIFDSTGWGIFFTGVLPSTSGSIARNRFVNNYFQIVNPGTLFSGSSSIKDNFGYNPVGYLTPDTVVGASPFTYLNNDVVTEDVYVIGGSGIAVTGSNGFSYPISGPIRLEPYQSLVISYFTIPTIKRVGF
jgi:hypothetical protein